MLPSPDGSTGTLITVQLTVSIGSACDGQVTFLLGPVAEIPSVPNVRLISRMIPKLRRPSVASKSADRRSSAHVGQAFGAFDTEAGPFPSSSSHARTSDHQVGVILRTHV